jgi:hypothetical protein
MGWVFNATPRLLYPRERPDIAIPTALCRSPSKEQCCTFVGSELPTGYRKCTEWTNDIRPMWLHGLIATSHLQLCDCEFQTSLTAALNDAILSSGRFTRGEGPSNAGRAPESFSDATLSQFRLCVTIKSRETSALWGNSSEALFNPLKPNDL